LLDGAKVEIPFMGVGAVVENAPRKESGEQRSLF
jgi:hypothetical protein